MGHPNTHTRSDSLSRAEKLVSDSNNASDFYSAIKLILHRNAAATTPRVHRLCSASLTAAINKCPGAGGNGRSLLGAHNGRIA